MHNYNIFISMLYINESKKRTNVISNNLPLDLDNRLYNLLYLFGGFNVEDVLRFTEKATNKKISELQHKVSNFPSTQSEVMPFLGGLEYLKNSKEYLEILDLLKNNQKNLNENLEIGPDGYPTIDTHPYFLEYITPKLKKSLFKLWDKKGKQDINDLKLFGVDITGYDANYFDNVYGIVFPLLVLEWKGGIQNTDFAKLKGFTEITQLEEKPINFKIEPISYDYQFDESISFGDAGWSCWNIRILIDKDAIVDNYTVYLGQNSSIKITDLFPQKYLNKEIRYKNFNKTQLELLYKMWEQYEEVACEYFCNFCEAEIVLV